ncbi:MAG TPA: 30S ribosomal protein S13 [Candidatus Norongarragalinales archaeon]|nr:30S ribosomal protein S13 [Candidatus Norongarragalinales archaeon]
MADETKKGSGGFSGKQAKNQEPAKPQSQPVGSTTQSQKFAKRKHLENKEFRGILRIVGQDVDGHFTVAEALRKVKGIGHNLASNLAIPVTTKLNVSLSELIGNLSEEQTTELEGIVKFPQKFGVKNFMLNRQQDIDSGEAKHLLMAELAFAKRQDITRERDSRSYRGWRHSIGQKTRGQHTRTTGRTGMTVGVLKKAVKAAKAAAATGAQEKSGGEKEKK